ncbi:GNAT family N-acetyltransferase [Acidobacteriota bacterium]
MFRVKNYSENEFAPITGFYLDLGRGETHSLAPEILSFKKRLKRPGYAPLRNLFLVKRDKKVVALLDTVYEENLDRLVLDFKSLPNVPRTELFEDLFGRADRLGQELGSKWIHISVADSDSTMRSLLEEMGLTHVRTLNEMLTGLDRDDWNGFVDETIKIGNFQSGDEANLAGLQNEIFNGSWGFNPNSAEDISYYIDITASRWKDILYLQQDGEWIGYVWTHRLTAQDRRDPLPRARIHMFGIRPMFQNKGLGHRLLSAGLQHLKNSGAAQVELTVDQENPAAISLYRSAGFVTESQTLWYEKSATLEGESS